MKSAKSTTTLYDLNSLLRVANVLICGLGIYLYSNIKEDSDVVNIFTLVLMGLIAIENIWMLSYEKRRRNPFIILLVLLVSVFYMARIVTLIHIPSSSVIFQKASLTAGDLNYTLIFIILSNAAMFLGIRVGGKNNVIREHIACADDPFPKVYNLIVMISLLWLVHYVSVFGMFPLLAGFTITVFFRNNIILLFTFTFIIYHYNKILPRIRVLLTFCVMVLVVLGALGGSRSTILTMGMLFLMSILVVKQRVMISKKAILICLILIPISIINFATATFKRQFEIETRTIVEHWDMMNEQEVFNFDRMEGYLGLIYNRIGFLDYSAELIANRQKFATIINGPYYVKSIIDNVLTPGFDIFGTVRVSHALSYVKRGEAIPDNYDEIALNYQSDELGIYGEYYVLFYGYPSLVAFFFTAFIFQWAFVFFKTTNVLLTFMYRAVLLDLFYIHMNSFGIDWIALDIVGAVITTFLFARFCVNFGVRKVVLLPPLKQIFDAI